MNRSLLSSLLILVTCVTTARSQQLDASFHAPVAVRASFINAMVAQPDGKILIGGDIAYHGNKPVNNLIRIAPDGTLEAAFAPDLPHGYAVQDIQLMTSGDILLLIRLDGTTGSVAKVVVINSAGAIMRQSADLAYSQAVAALPDGKVLVAGNLQMGGVKRLKQDLTIDDTFAVVVNGRVTDVEVQGEKIYLSGGFNLVNGVTKNDIVKLNLDGSIDESFDTGAGTSDNIGAITILPDGKVLPGKTYINSFNGVSRRGSVRLNNDGTVDPTLASYNFHGPISEALVIDDKIYWAAAVPYGGVTTNYLMRFTQDGARDESFTPVSFKEGLSYNIHTVKSGSELIISGPSRLGNVYGLIKSNAEGVLQPAFHPRISRLGIFRFGECVGRKLVIAGDFLRIDSLNTFSMARLNLDGTVDETFAISENYGPVEQLHLYEDGSILVTTDLNLFKVGTNGSLDLNFSWEPRPPLYQVYKFALQHDGKIIVENGNTMARLNGDGSYDASFTLEEKGSSGVFDFDFQGDDIIYGAQGLDEDPTLRVAPVVRRIKPDGSIDPTFSDAGPEKISDADFPVIDLVKVLDNGEILITGFLHQYAGAEVAHGLVKLSADGVLDETFSNNQLAAEGPSHLFGAAVQQLGDKIFIKTNSAIYSINLDGTVNEFVLPLDVESITAIVVIPSDEAPSGRTAVSEDQLIAIGSFYDANTKSRGAMVRLKLARPAQPNEPEEPEVVTSVGENYETLDLEIFPNPATDRLMIKTSTRDGLHVDVYGPTGVKIMKQRHSAAALDGDMLDVSELPPGVYFVKVVTSSGSAAVSKFIRKP